MVGHEPVHVERLASGLRVGAHDGMRIMRDALTDGRAAHRRIVVVVVDVYRLAPVDLLLHVGGQGFVGRIHFANSVFPPSRGISIAYSVVALLGRST